MKTSKHIVAIGFALVALLGMAGVASAHPHHVTTGNGKQQVLANGQNHPPFIDGISCEGVNEPADSGPAGYGLETAHHGPDQGKPGKADGCFASDGADRNPAID